MSALFKPSLALLFALSVSSVTFAGANEPPSTQPSSPAAPAKDSLNGHSPADQTYPGACEDKSVAPFIEALVESSIGPILDKLRAAGVEAVVIHKDYGTRAIRKILVPYAGGTSGGDPYLQVQAISSLQLKTAKGAILDVKYSGSFFDPSVAESYANVRPLTGVVGVLWTHVSLDNEGSVVSKSCELDSRLQGATIYNHDTGARVEAVYLPSVWHPW